MRIQRQTVDGGASGEIYGANWPQEFFIRRLLASRIESFLRKYAHGPTGSRLLDAGCGEQPYRGLAEQLNYQYVSCDRKQNSSATVTALCALDETIPDELLEKGPFDLVLCTEVMEHIADWNTAFRNLALLTAAGGRILITAPHVYQLHEEPFDYWRPTPHAFAYFANKAGLTIDVLESAGDGWDVLGTIVANLQPSPRLWRVRDRIMTLIVQGCVARLFAVLKRGSLQRHVDCGPGLYLSNVVVLKKANAGTLHV